MLCSPNRLIVSSLLLTGIISGCYNDKAELLYPANTCDTGTVTYSAVVKPILLQNCALSGCHNTSFAAGGVALEGVAGAQTIAKDGRLVGVITHAPGYAEMPKNTSKLDDCIIRKITAWVSAGAPDN